MEYFFTLHIELCISNFVITKLGRGNRVRQRR